MAIVNKPNTFSGNTTISSSEINSNFDTLYNEFNGSISSANLVDDAVTAAKLADNSVGTANITDAAVTPAKLSSTVGAWEVLANVTLSGAADTISSGTFTAKRFLRVLIDITHTGAAQGNMVFNGDTGNNYAIRYVYSGAYSSATAVSQIGAIFNNNATGASGGVVDIFNRSNAAKHGSVTGSEGTTNAGTVGTATIINFKWINNSAAITSITITNGAAGDFDAGSRLVVLGSDF
jgi:hypothetical protein